MQAINRLLKFSFCGVAAASLWTAAPAEAAPVTFWFSGKLEYINNPSNALPKDVTVGAPFTGRITYDPGWLGSSNWNSYPSGTTMNTYYTNTAGFSVLVQIGANIITNAPNPDGYPCGYVGVYDQFNNCDSLTIETSSADLIVNGNPTLQGNSFPLVSLYLRDDTKTAFSSASLPGVPPTTSQFQDDRIFAWEQLIDDGKGTRVFSVSGTITMITTNALVALNIRRQSSLIQLGWPLGVAGMSLQSSTNLSPGNWQDVPDPVTAIGMEQTVTLPANTASRFFRLKSGQ